MRSRSGMRFKKLADPGMTTEPRGLTGSHSWPADVSPPLSQDAAPPWMCVSPPPTQQQPGETPRRRHLIVKNHTTEMKFRNYATRALTTNLSFGLQTGDHTRP